MTAALDYDESTIKIREFGFAQYPKWRLVEEFEFEVYLAGFPEAVRFHSKEPAAYWICWETEIWTVFGPYNKCREIARRLTDAGIVRCYVRREER